MNKRASMVGWYDPGHLLRTGWQVLASTVFGAYADQRLVRAAVAGPACYFDCTGNQVKAIDLPPGSSRRLRQSPEQREAAQRNAQVTDVPVQVTEATQDFWFDYVSDVGDGWDPTYAVAYELSKDDLLQGKADIPEGGLRRGRVMVFGGDQAYPAAGLQAYEERLDIPYKTAAVTLAAQLAQKGVARPVHGGALFAIPGNHDWYDGLSAFSHVFCSRRDIAGRKTLQTRSYFALKLPGRWWLFGIDLQLGTEIDELQLEYFRKATTFFGSQDRVILCLPAPLWVYARKYDKHHESNLKRLEEEILKKHVAVWLAGDLHHYRRHEWPDGKVRITAGGGGAFLHPTHDHDGSDPKECIRVAKSFPEPQHTRRLCRLNFLFILANPLFGAVLGFIYVLLAVALFAPEAREFKLGLHSPVQAFRDKVEHLAVNPLPFAFWTVLLLGGFMLFTQSHNPWFRFIGGGLHGVLHYLAAFLLTLFGSTVARWLGVGSPYSPYDEIGEYWLGMLVVFLGGWVVSSFIMGLYLYVSLNIFRRHSTEAFSSLRIKDWKNFLRLHIAADGKLTIYAIGLRKVGRTQLKRNQLPVPKNEVELIERVPVP